MKRLLIILLAFALVIPSAAQKKKTQAKPVRKTQMTKTRKTAAPTKQRTVTYSNSSIRGLRNQRTAIQKKIREQEQALRANQADVKKRLQNLMVINSEIDERKKSIDVIQKDISHIEGNLSLLKSQLQTLEQQLNDRRMKYIRSMRYMAHHRSVQDKLMFIFSAQNFAQMYRRLRFVREYASYQRAQGEMVMAKQQEVDNKHKQLEVVRGHKNTLLRKDQQEHTVLQGKQAEQQEVVKGLQRQQKTIQQIIAQKRKEDAALNAQIDRLVEQEVAKAQARAAAEAKRKAAAAEAAKRRAEELRRKQEAARAAAEENRRRIAAAKAHEEQLKAEARAAAEKAEQDRQNQAAAARKAAADQAAREAEALRIATERKAEADAARNEREIASAKKNEEEARKFSSADRMMSGGFEANRGRLPMPITGSYRIVSHFGQYTVEGLKGVTLDNKGINILGKPGCMARSIYDGEVSYIISYAGQMVVMVRHGAYISVYCNLRSVSVSKGQRVAARQVLGAVGADNILQFQLRRETAKLNPEAWLGR